VWSDAALLADHSKPLIVAVLFFLCIVTPWLEGWNNSKIQLDQALLDQDSRLRIIEGEKPVESNINHFWIVNDSRAFKGKYLALNTDKLPEEQFISLTYTLPVEKDGHYKIFVATSGPGALRKKWVSDRSPFDVIIDNQTMVEIYEEKKAAFLKKTFGVKFYVWYSYTAGLVFSKVGEFFLSQRNPNKCSGLVSNSSGCHR